MKRLMYLGLIAASACSGSDPVVPMEPSAEQVRDFYALNPDSCILYATAGTQATATIPEPNTTAIAGKTLYIRRIRAAAGGLPQEQFFETDATGRLRLLRSVEGATAAERLTRNFPEATAPVFLDLEFDLQQQLRFEGDRFEVEVTPEVCGDPCMDVPLERHTWTVSAPMDVTLPKGLGVREGYTLNYRIERDGSQLTSIYTLVPGIGFVNFTNATGTTFNACDLRACAAAGTCEGAASCADLSCN